MSRYIFTVLFLLPVLCALAHSAVIHGVRFSDQYEIGAVDLQLRGGSIKRYLGFRIWIGCLYLEDKVPSQEALKDVPKKLVIQYLVDIPSAEIARATEIGMRNNVAPSEFSALHERLRQVNGLWPNVQKGDRYEVLYFPGQGTSFVFNGRLQDTIMGEDFARAFFSIWIGEKPIDKRLKQMMLHEKM